MAKACIARGWVPSHRDLPSCSVSLIMLLLLLPSHSRRASHLTEMTSPSSTNPNFGSNTGFLIFFDKDTFLPALMVESTLYGIYLVTFVACLRRLLRTEDRNWKHLRDVNLTITLVVVLMFISSTLNLLLLLVHNTQDVISDPEEGSFIVGRAWSKLLRVLTFLQNVRR